MAATRSCPKRVADDAGFAGSTTRCEIRGSFAFVTYKDERDAEDAIKNLQGKEVGGCRMSIEWTKESGKAHLNAPREHAVRCRYQSCSLVLICLL